MAYAALRKSSSVDAAEARSNAAATTPHKQQGRRLTAVPTAAVHTHLHVLLLLLAFFLSSSSPTRASRHSMGKGNKTTSSASGGFSAGGFSAGGFSAGGFSALGGGAGAGS